MAVNADIKVTGLDEALARMDREIQEIENLSQAGLWEAGLKVLRAAQKRLRASVVTGNLRASGYARANTDFNRPNASDLIPGKNEDVPREKLPEIGVELGFTANYALFAHENMEGRAPKFLESVIVENEQNIVRIVAQRSGADQV